MRLLSLLIFLVFWGCGDDSAQPSTADVKITEPEEGALLSQNRVEVRGTAQAVNSIDLNGEVIDVVGGEWRTTVNAPDGPLELIATAESATDSVNVVVDSQAPTLVLEEPERGFYRELGSDSIRVKGRVEDGGTGIASLFWGGQSVALGADGGFEFDAPLREGLNEVVITAVDEAGNEATTLRGGMYGAFETPTQEVERAFRLFIREEALQTIEKVVQDTVTPQLVSDFVAANFVNDNVTIQGITFDPIEFDIVTRTNALELVLNVSNVAVTGTFTIGSDAYPTTIEVVKMGVTLPLSVGATPEGSLSLEFGTAVLDLEDEDLRFNIAGLTQDDAQFLRNVMRQVVEYAFANFLSEQVFEQLFDPDILKRRIEVFGRVISFELKFETVRVFPDGILLELSLSMPDDEFELVRDVPGALNRTPGNPNGPNSANDLLFTTTHQALDRILHGVWRSGLLHQTFDQERFAGFDLPVGFTVNELSLALDGGIAALAPPSTPAAIRLYPLLPPVVDLSEESTLSILLSEMMVDLVLQPPGGEEILVASFSFFLELDVLLSLEGVEIVLGFETNVRADLADEPNIDLNDRSAEVLFEDVIKMVPDLLADSLRLTGEADITWVTLTNPELELHGEADHCTLSTTMVPNPDGFVLEF